MTLKTQVAIIGCGPTGALLGNLLGRRGISNIIVEKQSDLYPLPRAVHFDAETMRIFQSAGLADEVLPTTLVGKGMLFKDNDGQVLVDWSRDQTVGPMGWHESYRFHQPELESILRNGLSRFANTTLLSGCGVDGVSQNDDGVLLSLADGREIEAEYVVGCDGAQSFLRNALGVEYDDLGFKEKWLVVDLELVGSQGDYGDYTVQFCNPDNPATYIRGVGNRRRWEIRLSDHEDEPETDAQVWQRLGQWVTPDVGRLERSAVYVFRSCIAMEWQVGRCFLAGDAAHLTPPFMGQGLCAGARDAANLAWKLAAVLGGSDKDLLETYQAERQPNAHAYIDLAVRLGRLINQTAAGEAPQGVMKSIWPELGPGLGPRDGLAGTLAPQVKSPTNLRSDDEAGGGFYVLAKEMFKCDLPVFVGASDWLVEKNAFAVIIRPDGYVLAGGSDATEISAHCNELEITL